MKDLQKQVIQEFSYDMTQSGYLKHAEEGFWKSEKIVIKKYFKPNSSVLDIGCGTGRTTIPLFKMKYKVRGVDITPNMIKNAKKMAKKKKLKIKYEVGDATKLKFKDNSFDNALFSNNGWTQIPGDEKRTKALEEIYRVLKPGGYFIFTAHIRKMRGFTFFWMIKWIRFFILKPLGFPIFELDFGDRLFWRDNAGINHPGGQYIHIPNVNHVKEQIKEAGFKLVLMKPGNEITGEKEYWPMFYVCRK